MDIEYEGVKYLYNEPGGRIIKELKHDSEAEDFIRFTVINRNDSMFYVEACYSIKGFISKGWVKKDKLLGIYSRAYDKNMKLYSEPNRSSSIVYQEGYKPEMYNVIDSHGQWLKIKLTVKGKVYEGWMPPEIQCSNVYSTCS